jgi:hypothetical protein
VAVTVVYAAVRASDRQFLDAAMSGLLSTVAGVALGVPVGLWIARRQSAAEASERESSERRSELEHLDQVVTTVALELSANGDRIKRLDEVLQHAARPRADLWAAAVAVADSFSYSAYEELRRFPRVFQHLENHLLVLTVFASLRTLAADVRAAQALHAFYLGFSANREAAAEDFESVRKAVQYGRGVLAEASESCDRLLDEIRGAG